MESQSQAQWVVRLPDRLIQLQRPLQAIRVFSTAEVLQFKTYYNSGNSKVRIERQHDSNERQADVPFAYWVVLVPTGAAADPAIEVLCCTVQRETADRILDSLWMSLFTNCGDNTFVDLRQLLAADRITPEMVAAAPAVGRFVDLDDGEYRRPVAAVVSVADAAIPVEIIPAHANTPRNVSNTDWRYAAGAGVPARLLVQSQQDIGVEIVTSILGGESQIRSGQQVQAAAMSPVIDAVRTAAEDSGVVQNIGRGRSIADVRLELERHAAVQRTLWH